MGLACGKSAFADTAHLVQVHRKASNIASTSTQSRTGTLATATAAATAAAATAAAVATANEETPATIRDQGIVVLVRIRPKSSREQAQRCCLEVQGPTQLHVPASKKTPAKKTYRFDAVLPETTSQEKLYQGAGPKLLQNALQGFNATMIAYGQTGSGKTFTMEGTAQDPGVTPRLCRGLFEAIFAQGIAKQTTVQASFIEIYQETIRDLLDSNGAQTVPGRGMSPPKSRSRSPTVSPPVEAKSGAFLESNGKFRPTSPVNIRENKDGVYVENATTQKVDSEAAVLALLARGSSARTKGETLMNAASSRSHAVLTLSITQSSADDKATGDVGGTIRSKIALVDLAGSERAKSTGAGGQRLKEGAQINKSLSALGNVIKALTSGGSPHVPYRDSKLTRLLQDSLGGTAYTVVCCNVSPVEESEPETVSTLRFAERLKKVKNKLVVHMDARSKELCALKRENVELRAKVELLEGMVRGGAGIPTPEYTPGNQAGRGIRKCAGTSFESQTTSPASAVGRSMI